MPHEAVTVRRSASLALLALSALSASLAFLVMAPRAAAKPSDQAEVEKCVADHVSGQEVRLQNRLLEARSHFRACAQATCPSVVSQACSAFLVELEPRIPTIIPVVRDEAGDDLVDGSLLLDGKAVPLAALGQAREVEPGQHELRFERGGRVLAQRTVTVSEGEKNRRLQLTVATAALAPASSARAAVGWVGIGLGAAAIAGSVVLWSVASAEHAELEGTCAPACKEDVVAGPKAKALVGDVLLGGGLALAAAGAFLVLLPPAPAGAPPKVAATPYFMIDGRGAGVGVVVRAF